MCIGCVGGGHETFAIVFNSRGCLGPIGWSSVLGRVKDRSDAAADKAEKELLAALDIAEVTKVQITAAGEAAPIVLEKQNVWFVTSPVRSVADQSQVANYLKTLQGINYEKALSEGLQDLKVYGLEPPQLAIELSHGDQQTTLNFGDKTPVGLSRYLQVVGSEPLYITGSHNFKPLNRKLFEFRDKSLRLGELAELSQLSLVGSEEITIVKEQGVWQIAEGGAEPVAVDQNFLDGFFAKLSGNKIEQFIDQPAPELAAALEPSNSATELLGSLSWTDQAGRRELAVSKAQR